LGSDIAIEVDEGRNAIIGTSHQWLLEFKCPVASHLKVLMWSVAGSKPRIIGDGN
jgi:hypothetical protein